MITIKELAKACGVSIATVSNILNNKGGASEETKKRVIDAARNMNYTPNIVAKNLKMKNTRSIGVVAEDMTIFSIPDIIDGITQQCEEVDYHILLTNLRLFKKHEDTYYHKQDFYEDVHKEIRKLQSKQVEGLIYISAHERIIECIPNDIRIPAVMAYGYSNNPNIPSVVVDDEEGAYQLVDHLASMGHRKIGVITGKKDSLHMQARLEGYQKALYDNNILFNPGYSATGDWTRKSGYNSADKLIDQDVTAIFCMNDVMAGGVYDRMEERGLRIGKDISIVGFDNREVSSFYKPPLTTTTLPLHDIGYKASEIMMNLLNHQAVKEVYKVPCEFLKRESVGKNVCEQ
ncbi:LacI family transcriptional regulator [Lachnospiraceae bacterium PF1-22]